MKSIISILIIAGIILSSCPANSQTSFVEKHKYTISTGAVAGGILIYTYIKKNTNPDAKEFAKKVKEINILIDNSGDNIIKNKETIVSEMKIAHDIFEKAKDKPLTFHKNFSKDVEILNNSYTKLNNELFKKAEINLTQYETFFSVAANKIDTISLEKYNDSILNLYKKISWVRENAYISNIKSKYETNRNKIQLLKTYNRKIETLIKISKTTQLESIAALSSEIDNYEKKLRDNGLENIINLKLVQKSELKSNIRNSYNNYLNSSDEPKDREQIRDRINIMQKYYSLLSDDVIKNSIQIQKANYNKYIEKELNNNLNKLNNTPQNYKNVAIFQRYSSENERLFSIMFADVTEENLMHNLREKNLHYTKVEEKIRSDYNVSQEKKQEKIDENYYEGHYIHTGPRGGRYYINSNGNKVYVKR